MIIGQKKYCHFCSASLVKKECEGSLRLFCESCDEPMYENPIPATAVVVIDNKERLLLVKRSVEPKIGFWCLPGGFMELGETPEQGALRELEEETGLIGKIDRLIDVSTSPNPFYITVVLIGYLILKHSGDNLYITSSQPFILSFIKDSNQASLLRFSIQQNDRISKIYEIRISESEEY